MTQFKFNKQSSTEIYRKWYILEKKLPGDQYDKGQIDDLFFLIKSQIADIIDQLVNQQLYTYRSEIPFLFINGQNFDTYTVEIYILENKIECLSMPGCIVEAENRDLAFDNLIKAIIQCSDARIRNGLWYLNRAFPRDYYESHPPIMSNILIQQLKSAGWTTEYIGSYHTVLLRKESKVTYTIPNDTEISSRLLFSYNRLQYLMSGRQHGKMYGN